MKKQSSKPRVKKQTAMAVALATAGVTNVGLPTTVQDGVLHSFDEFSKDKSVSLLSNPMADDGYIETLTRYNDFWGTVALRVLTKGIGHSVVNTVLWDYRKRNQAPEITSSIDWLNDEMAEAQVAEASKKNLEEQGQEVIPFLDGNTMIGAYKWLVYRLNTIEQGMNTPSKFEAPVPAVIYNDIRQKDKSAQALAELDKFEMERLRDSPAFEDIKEKIEQSKMADHARQARKAQDELDHIHATLSHHKSERFDDGVWARIPLYVQYRIMRSVYNQINSALAKEMEKPGDERFHVDDLRKLSETVLLELQAADRTAEVKAAFKKGILKVQHALRGSENLKLIPQQ